MSNNTYYKIIFITSAQVSANPRLLKEALSLFSAGFEVKVIWCPLSPWADNFDEKLFLKYRNIHWVKAGYNAKDQPICYLYARLRQKVWQYFYKIFGNKFDAAIKSLVLFSQELTSLAINHKADVYIGHNLGALTAIVKASKAYKAKSIFDFEDYYRGELDDNSIYSRMIKDVENIYIPRVSSITAASPAIAEAYRLLFLDQSFSIINNCFPLEYSIKNIRTLPQKPLKLFWFSQYIGKQRGLESVLKAMSLLGDDEITLTLIGSISSNIKQYYAELLISLNIKIEQILFLGPVSEDNIVSIATMHHIGLASEFVHNQNRDLCLTNKLFMYLLAGNAIVATDTLAQKYFLNENQGIGSLYEQEDAIDLTRVLKNYIDNPELLDIHRKNALDLSKTKYNWDIEKGIFLKNVAKVLAL